MGSGGSGKDKVARPPKGMMDDPRPIYYGNPRNMDPGLFRPVGSPPVFVPKPSLVSGTKPKDKNSLMSRNY